MHFTFLLVFFLIQFIPALSSDRCGVRTSLFLSNPLPTYVSACQCPPDTGAVLSRISTTNANASEQTEENFSCLRTANAHLVQACEHSISAFEHAASDAHTRCATIESSPESAGQRSDLCEAELFSLSGGSSVVWLCKCPQDEDRRIGVVKGRAQFDAEGVEEGLMVETCTRDDLDRLTEICRISAKDFSVAALQGLQSCCKRVRVRTGNNLKLECRTVVPDNVTDLINVINR